MLHWPGRRNKQKQCARQGAHGATTDGRCIMQHSRSLLLQYATHPAVPTRPLRHAERERVVRQEPGGRQPADGVHHRRRPHRHGQRARRDLPRRCGRTGEHPRAVSGGCAGRGRDGGLHPCRGSHPGHRRRRRDPLFGGRGRLHRDRPDRRARRQPPGARGHQDPGRRDRDVSAENGEADHQRDADAASRGRHRRLRTNGRAYPQDGRRAGAQRPGEPPGNHPGRVRERSPLRNLHRGVGGGVAAPRTDLRRRRPRRPAVVDRPAGWIDPPRERRDPAADRRAGIPRAGVRGPGPPGSFRRHAVARGRRRRRGRRVCRDRSVRAPGRRAGRAPLRSPHRRRERHGDLPRGERLPGTHGTHQARGHQADELDEPGRGAGRSAGAHAGERPHGPRARVRPARRLPRAAPRVLGQPGNPHLVPGHVHAHAGPRRHREHRIDLRLHHGARHRRGRRHHRGRERLPPPGSRPRRPGGRSRGSAGSGDAGLLRRPDHRGGVRPVAVRAGPPGQDDALRAAHRHPLPAVLAGRVAQHPAGAPGPPENGPPRPLVAFPERPGARARDCHRPRIPARAGGVPPLALSLARRGGWRRSS